MLFLASPLDLIPLDMSRSTCFVSRRTSDMESDMSPYANLEGENQKESPPSCIDRSDSSSIERRPCLKSNRDLVGKLSVPDDASALPEDDPEPLLHPSVSHFCSAYSSVSPSLVSLEPPSSFSFKCATEMNSTDPSQSTSHNLSTLRSLSTVLNEDCHLPASPFHTSFALPEGHLKALMSSYSSSTETKHDFSNVSSKSPSYADSHYYLHVSRGSGLSSLDPLEVSVKNLNLTDDSQSMGTTEDNLEKTFVESNRQRTSSQSQSSFHQHYHYHHHHPRSSSTLPHYYGYYPPVLPQRPYPAAMNLGPYPYFHSAMPMNSSQIPRAYVKGSRESALDAPLMSALNEEEALSSFVKQPEPLNLPLECDEETSGKNVSHVELDKPFQEDDIVDPERHFGEPPSRRTSRSSSTSRSSHSLLGSPSLTVAQGNIILPSHSLHMPLPLMPVHGVTPLPPMDLMMPPAGVVPLVPVPSGHIYPVPSMPLTHPHSLYHPPDYTCSLNEELDLLVDALRPSSAEAQHRKELTLTLQNLILPHVAIDPVTLDSSTLALIFERSDGYVDSNSPSLASKDTTSNDQQPSSLPRSRFTGASHLIRMLQSERKPVLLPFGSAVSGLSLRQADMDFCLFIDTKNVNFNSNASSLSVSYSPVISMRPSGGFYADQPSLDGCFFTDEKHEEQARVISKLGDILRQGRIDLFFVIASYFLLESRFYNIKVLTRARIPIIKLRDTITGISCDIGVNNELAIYNTSLLSAYGAIDRRLISLALVIKYWAKRRGLNEPYSGTLSSYCYLMMVIFYLQRCDPPVLPVLQQLKRSKSNGTMKEDASKTSCDTSSYESQSSPSFSATVSQIFVDDFDVYFFRDIESLGAVWPEWNQNQDTLVSLLSGFFKYYAYDFPYATSVLSIRTGELLSKESKGWTIDKNSPRDSFWFCVEDPFEVTHNLARVVTRNSLFYIRGQFIRASKLLSRQASLAHLCMDYAIDYY